MPARALSVAPVAVGEPVFLPATTLTVDDARALLAGWQAPRRSRRNYEADMLTLGFGFLALVDAVSGGIPAAPTVLTAGGLDVPLDRARARVSGWHFAQESLRPRERELLYVLEGLLRLVDERAPGGYLR